MPKITDPKTPVRKTTRTIKPTLKAKESELLSKIASPVLSDSDDCSDDLELNSDVEKPVILHENEVVHGEDIFHFQKRKQKNSLAQKVAEACSQKTPFIVRNKTKNRIAKVLIEDSGSEYELSSECSSSSSETNSSDEGDESSGRKSEEEKPKSQPVKSKVQYNEASLKQGSTKNKINYVIKTEEYFEHCSSNKVKTSNNTLDKLENPRLPQLTIHKLLRKVHLTEQHQKAIENMDKKNEDCFKKWLYILNEDFNILVHGLGSKRDLLKKFHSDFLQNVPVIVVNGFFPTLHIKNILDGILNDLLEIQESPGNINEATDLIVQEFNNMPELHLYLIVHNIEGEMLRNKKTQNILSKLADVKNIHLIASIDQIYGPLIWDQRNLSAFRFIWWDVTTFKYYDEEIIFDTSLMVEQTGTLALSSLRNVFLSLTTNSKSIYMIIAKHQLENTKNHFYQGISFKDLYMACREAFIVSSDLALRAQLTEFLDHKMIKQKRSVDGTEYLNIPLTAAVLQKFVDANS